MQKDNLQLAKGMRDFAPAEQIVRNRIVSVLKKKFEQFGYNPLETPVVERYELFASKFAQGNQSEAMQETFKLSDQGKRKLVLRNEFTVPLARFIALNPQLKMPFKRYQVGPVFRDGPIKLGRYRQFWQCDVDAVGVKSPRLESELLQLANEVFKELGLKVEIKLNNRKILSKIISLAGIKVAQEKEVIIAIDKLDKIGRAGVKKELAEKGMPDKAIDFVLKTISVSGNNQEVLKKVQNIIGENEGLDEVAETLKYILDNKNVVFSPSLARGLAYYTGNVFEIFLQDQAELSSALSAGGRYDEMISGFLKTEQEYPAVGISFGLETIFDALQLNNRKTDKPENQSITQVYIIPFGEKAFKTCLLSAKELRKNGINADIDYSGKNMRKNLDYANSYNIPWVIIVGEDELKAEKVALRNMQTGKQELVSLDKAIREILN